MRTRLLVLLLVAFSVLTAAAQPKEFRNWPSGTSPAEVGLRLSQRFATSVDMKSIYPGIYPAICGWYGALRFSEATHNTDLREQLIRRFDDQYTPQIIALGNDPHVDHSIIGAVPLETYIQLRDTKRLNLGRSYADAQWKNPTPDGLSGETRYWIDDMYMLTILQLEAYRATGETKYLDHAAQEMTAYLDRLQQPNGLFFHAPDVPFYWGRGNGWVAAGMTEMLSSLPAKHPRRARILAGYKSMMSALLRYQGSDGLWRQLIDHPEAWQETSSSAMFTFAMVKGVRNGWLPAKQYAPAARKAWIALVGYLEPNGDIRNVCEGTGKKNDLQYYLDRRRLTGDLHGQAPMLWTAWALSEKD